MFKVFIITNFVKNWEAVFRSSCAILYFQQRCMEDSNLSSSLPILVFSFKNIIILLCVCIIESIFFLEKKYRIFFIVLIFWLFIKLIAATILLCKKKCLHFYTNKILILSLVHYSE